MFTAIIGHVLAVGIGLSLGLMGGGGSVLAVPILVYVMGLSPKVAIAMSLLIVGSVSVIGLIPHWLQGNVNLKTVAVFTPLAMLGAYLGALLTSLPLITDTLQLVCFGLVMLLTSILMIRKGSTKSKPQDTQTTAKRQDYWFALPIEGLGVGMITGFVGVGGGFLIVPALVLLRGIPMKEAIGTSLMIIVFNSAAGFLGYLSQVNLDWHLIISFTFAASLGTVGGAYLTKLINAKQLEKGFGYFVLAVAVFVLIKR
ncbi:TSUP family transporter [Lyngbya aestuarii]|uniref:TSUP family transporter n=1 Tax=Lyngbya aestuarii TaxID=118322 RepID=UPI00403E3124